MPPIVSIIGRSKSGKTTLLEKLIPELTRRGYRIGVIKHSFHELEFDKPGKDSWRFNAAGAETIVLSTEGLFVMVKKGPEKPLDELAGYFKDMDLVLTEGFKRSDKPRIEVLRKEQHQELLSVDHPNLVACVTDAEVSVNVPIFGLDEIVPLADLIEEKFL